MKLLFLYTELAGYSEACIKELAKQVEAIHIVRFPVNAEAPFRFTFPENVKVYERNSFTNKQLLQLAKEANPDAIFASGWVDKGYLKVCRHFKGHIPTVMGMDNHWLGSARQWIMRAVAPFTVGRSYSDVWVPGRPQKEYATKLGFGHRHIREGFYCANVPLFAPEAPHRTQANNYPHRFVYVGRYIAVKALDLLFAAFTEAVNETGASWELWCAGIGESFEERIIHPQIKHFGFMQPAELNKMLQNTGVFVLPSHFEPWGVVVHEMAAAGFPMICSSAVGAASQFLQPTQNGYGFKSGDKNGLKAALKKIMETSDTTLKQMAAHSHKLGIAHTPAMWAQTAIEFGRKQQP